MADKFYTKMYNVAKKLIDKRGTTGSLDTGTARYDIRIVFFKPDSNREQEPLERNYITQGQQRACYFQFTSPSTIFKPEMGHTIVSGGETMTIKEVDPLAPANFTLLYDCILEV